MIEPHHSVVFSMHEDGVCSNKELRYSFPIKAGDFSAAGSVSTRIKKILQQIGVKPDTIRRASIATYEAELNVVIHSNGGEMVLTANPHTIEILCKDQGPGIPDIDLAMQPGFSTAPDEVREMGFGAGMGLPNMQRCADEMKVCSEVGVGTTVDMVFKNE